MLLARTDGNPFLLGELLRHLAETGGLDHADGRGLEALEGVPEGVRHMTGAAAVPAGDPAVTGALDLAAVIGRDFDLAVLTQVSDLERRGPARRAGRGGRRAGAGAAVRGGAGPVRVQPRHRPRAPSTAASRAARRRRLHLRVGEALERLPPGGPDARLSWPTTSRWPAGRSPTGRWTTPSGRASRPPPTTATRTRPNAIARPWPCWSGPAARGRPGAPGPAAVRPGRRLGRGRPGPPGHRHLPAGGGGRPLGRPPPGRRAALPGRGRPPPGDPGRHGRALG